MDDLLRQLNELGEDERRQALAHLNTSLADTQNENDESGSTIGSEASGPAVSTQQRVIVQMPSRPPPRRLRLFSGKAVVPSGEVDFETWRLSVEQLLSDTSLTEEVKKLTMLESLSRPAIDVIRSISSTSTAQQCMEMLTNMYGQVQDGHDLLVDFLVTYQEPKESASEYINRLYLKIVQVADKGGVTVAALPTQLLRQFVRGCHDEPLVHKLGLVM